MAYIPGSDPFKTLSNAFGGTAKGAFDYTQVRLKQNQIDESKRQHDQNLRLGFKRLDEQIRQFDVGTKEHRELTEARMKLDATLRREGFTSAEKRASTQAGAVVASARMRQQTADRNRQYQRDLSQRNYTTGNLINNIEQFAGDLWKDWNAHEGPTEFAWDARANVAARQLAEAKAMGEPVTEDDIALARRQIDNYDNIKSQHLNDRVSFERAKRGQAMLDDGAWGEGTGGDFVGIDKPPVNLYQDKSGTKVGTVGNDWETHMLAQYQGQQYGEAKSAMIRRIAAHERAYGAAVHKGVQAGDNSIPQFDAKLDGLLRDAGDMGVFSQSELQDLKDIVVGRKAYWQGPGQKGNPGEWVQLSSDDQATQAGQAVQAGEGTVSEAEAVGIADRAAKIQAIGEARKRQATYEGDRTVIDWSSGEPVEVAPEPTVPEPTVPEPTVDEMSRTYDTNRALLPNIAKEFGYDSTEYRLSDLSRRMNMRRVGEFVDEIMEPSNIDPMDFPD